MRTLAPPSQSLRSILVAVAAVATIASGAFLVGCAGDDTNPPAPDAGPTDAGPSDASKPSEGGASDSGTQADSATATDSGAADSGEPTDSGENG
ncbi:MAG: hypothetical protein ACLQVI_16125 [Polyangiaceae bacterium]|jgi:hypothetical protein